MDASDSAGELEANDGPPVVEPADLMGSVTLLADEDQDYFVTGIPWGVER